MSQFLDRKDIAILTGIKIGKAGKSRQLLQSDHLRMQGIPFRLNVRGEPVVTWEAVNGGVRKDNSAHSWQPALINSKKIG